MLALIAVGKQHTEEELVEFFMLAQVDMRNRASFAILSVNLDIKVLDQYAGVVSLNPMEEAGANHFNVLLMSNKEGFFVIHHAKRILLPTDPFAGENAMLDIEVAVVLNVFMTNPNVLKSLKQWFLTYLTLLVILLTRLLGRNLIQASFSKLEKLQVYTLKLSVMHHHLNLNNGDMVRYKTSL